MVKKDSKGRNLKPNEDQLSDGRYRYRYIDKDGKRRSIYAWKLVKTDKMPANKRDGVCLREKEKSIERDIDDGIQTYKAKEISVSQLILSYLETKARLANSTMGNYKHMLEKNIAPSILGEMSITNVKKSDIKKFYAYLHGEREFSTGTIQLYQNLIYPAFQMAVDDDLIRKNPCKGCMKDYTGKGLSTTRYPLSREEQKTLLSFVNTDTIYSRYYTMIAFMLATGCRIGEVIGITWDNIDFEKKIVNVDHQVIYKKKNGKTQHYTELPKNRLTRTIPLKQDIISILKQYRRETYFISKSSGCTLDGYTNFVFLNNEAKLYTPNTLTRTFHGIRDAYNKTLETEDKVLLPDFTAHTLRHTFCTRMAENGTDIKVLQMIMGHKTIAVTMQIYNHVSEERLKNSIENIESSLAV